MKRFIFTFLCILPLLSWAQTQVPITCGPHVPAISDATGTELRAGWNSNGAWRGHWCPKNKFAWDPNPACHVVLASLTFTGNLNSAINEVMFSANPEKAYVTALRVYDIQPTEAQKPAFHELMQLCEADMRQHRPTDPAYKVDKATRSDKTRPVYRLGSDGQPGLEVARAQENTPCQCSAFALESGKKVWCPPAGASPTVVTLCVPATE